ncbi:MAG: PAS domain S-box protein [Candidatus Hinthialibacter antarcticus]|nr:PAS domain S-box protein [Candidatus Hinthialibacter antarcticus]
MKSETKVILFSVMCGAAFWIIDAVLDTLFFYEGSFVDIFLLHVPTHELYVRLVVCGVFLFGGYVFSLVLRRREQTERELIESERRLATLLGNLPGIAYRCKPDAQWTMMYSSEGCSALTGYNPDEVLSNRVVSYGELIHPDDQQMVGDEIQNATRQKRPFELTYRILAKFQEIKWVWERGVGVYSPNDELMFLEGFITDISDMIHLRDDLREQVQHNHLIQQSAIDGFCTLDEKGRIQNVNSSFTQMLGYSEDELLDALFTTIHEKEKEFTLVNHLDRARKTGKDLCITQLKQKKGGSIDVEVVSSSYLFGEERFVFSVVRDVSSRIKTEAYLKESEERYRLLFNHLKAGVAYCKVVYDDVGQACDFLILHANPAFHRSLGQTRSTLIGLKGSELFLSVNDGREDWFHRLGVSALSGVEVCEERYYEQMERWFSVVSYSPKRDHFVILFDDITDRKAAEQKLRELNQTLENVIQASPLAIATVDRDRCVNTWNSEAESIFGWKSEEVIGQPYPIIPDGMEDEFEDFFKRLVDDPYTEHETKRKRKDGTLIDVRVSTAPMFNSEGEIIGVVAILADISQQKEEECEKERLKDQLQHAQRMEAVGQLAGGVAHDFNNLLMVIQGYSDLAASRLDEDSQTRKELGEIFKATERAANITKQLLAFSRKQVINLERININEVIVDVEKMVQHLIPDYIEVTTSLENSVSEIEFDRGQIEQIFVNLAINARDAMPDGGTLLIETQNVVLNQDQSERLGCEYGGYVCISVTDNGVGMSPEVQQRIFEPFFTTKDFGKGTGLGLSTVYGIVKQAKGGVEVISDLGQGSVFKLYFPIASGEKPPQVFETPASPVVSGNATILLVEDAKAVRELTRRILSESGYKVFAASGSQEAVELCRMLDFPVDLVLSDIVMPNGSGFDVARQVRKLYPAAKILFMTGYANQDLPIDEYEGRVPEMLMKPFSPNDLLKAVRRTLDAV